MGKKPRFQRQRGPQHADLTQPPALWDESTLYDQLAGRKDSGFVLILDCVQDPHNLGACIRSADAAGVDAVIVPKDKAAGLTDVVRRVACGGAEHTPFVQVTNLVRCLTRLKELGLWLVGTADEARQSLHEIDLSGPLGIAMGAEGKGLRRLTREHCDFLVRIPMAAQAKVNCLNVSVAAGVLLFEARRQRAMAASNGIARA